MRHRSSSVNRPTANPPGVSITTVKGSSFTSTRRPDFAKSWQATIDLLNRRTRSLVTLRTDDRYHSRLDDLKRSRRDLVAAQDVIAAILADFDTLNPPPAGE